MSIALGSQNYRAKLPSSRHKMGLTEEKLNISDEILIDDGPGAENEVSLNLVTGLDGN